MKMSDIDAVFDELEGQGVKRIRFETFFNFFQIAPDDLTAYIADNPGWLKIVIGISPSTSR
jgi:hypothetical protein